MAAMFKGRPVTAGRVVDAVRARVRSHFVHPIFGTVPRYVWGNDAGLRGNLWGRYDIMRSRRAWTNATPTSPDAEKLRDDGFVTLDPHYPNGLVDDLRAQYARLIDDDASAEWNGVGRYMHASRALKAPAKDLHGVESVLTRDIRDTVEAYYRSHFRVLHVRAWRTFHVPNLGTEADAFSNQWHNDMEPITMLRLFVYLSDGVTRESGAFRLHPIRSTRQIVRSGGYFQRNLVLPHTKTMLEDPSRIVYLEGAAGTSCLANVQLCLHRAGVPAAGRTRDILQLTFRPSSRALPADWVSQLS